MIFDPRQENVESDRNCDQAVSLIHVYRTLCEMTGIECPEYVDGSSLAGLLNAPDSAFDPPAITTWGRGNYSVRDDHWRYTRYFDGSEELYDHRVDPNEWNNLADVAAHANAKERLARHLPQNEAPLIKQGISLWNVIDADQPNKLKTFQTKQWPEWTSKMKPRLE